MCLRSSLLQLINRYLYYLHSFDYLFVIVFLIGKGGSKIKEIQEKSGARVKVCQTFNQLGCVICIIYKLVDLPFNHCAPIA